MKPIHLEIQAFGAFVEKQTLDFRRLEQHRIFLIHGQTGAGKSTIFDAICYALYGETSGIRNARKMRSELASANLDTIVKFRFELKGKEYVVQRGYKLTANGAESDKNKFYQTEVDNDKAIGLVLTQKVEIKEHVKSLLGLKPDEFKQLILLPQGKFQELLHANTKDKTALLKNIFNAEEFEQIVAKLKDKSQATENALQQATDAQQTLLKNSGLADRDELLETIRLKSEELDIQKVEERQCKNLADEASKIYEAAKNLHADFLELEKLEAQKKELLALSQDMERSSNVLAKAQSAMQLEDSLLALEKAEEGNALRQKNIEKLKEELSQLEFSLSNSKTHLATAQQQAAQLPTLRTTLAQWQSYFPISISWSGLENELKSLASEEQTAKNNLETASEKVDGVKKNIDKLRSSKPSFIAEAATIESLKVEAGRIREIGLRKKELETKTADLDNTKKLSAQRLNAFDTSRVKERQAYETYDALLASWRRNQATLLALELKDDQPCPVCGSTVHPDKAVSHEGMLVTDHMLENAKTALESTQKELANAQKAFEESKPAVESLEREISSLQGAIGEKYLAIDIELFRQQFKETDEKLKKAETAKTTLEQVTSESERLQTELDNLEKTLAESQQKLSNAAQNKAVKIGEQKQIESSLPLEARDKHNVESKIQGLTQSIASLEHNLLVAQKNVEESEQKVVSANATLASESQNYLNATLDFEKLQTTTLQKITVLGFESSAEAKAALLDEQSQNKLANTIEHWKQERTANEAKIETLASKTVGKSIPAIETLQAAAEQAQLKVITLNKTIGNTDAQISQLRQLEKALEKLQQEREALLKNGEDILKMSKLASGSNPHKQPFDTYVIGFLLEQVLLFANSRLNTLSEGRYSLVRSEEVSGGGHKGLELCVNDTYTGKQRDVKNLSGGETFFTSLALALGLADYTSARNGGIKLEALFIDEGFGSLSGNYLEKAINVLMEDSENRLIGLISHVSELQERFKNQCVEVRKTETGSIIEY